MQVGAGQRKSSGKSRIFILTRQEAGGAAASEGPRSSTPISGSPGPCLADLSPQPPHQTPNGTPLPRSGREAPISAVRPGWCPRRHALARGPGARLAPGRAGCGARRLGLRPAPLLGHSRAACQDELQRGLRAPAGGGPGGCAAGESGRLPAVPPRIGSGGPTSGRRCSPSLGFQ